jgi:probable H4MPT-linked C1 transfer pathway protein
LRAGELVYTGVQRSPVCALVSEIPWRGAMYPVAQELFATTWDAYLTLGELPEEAENTSTADGRPATKEAARDRLARMICADREMFTPDDALAAARHIRDGQLALLIRAANGVVARPSDRRHLAPRDEFISRSEMTALVCGTGEFLARQVAARLGRKSEIVSLTDEIGAGPSHCAPAHALAVLAREEAQT